MIKTFIKYSLVFILLLLCGFSTSCSDEEYVYGIKEVYYITNCKSGVNLRTLPSLNSKVVRAIPKDTDLDSVVSYNNTWSKVFVSSGDSGYVKNNFLAQKKKRYIIREKEVTDYLQDKDQTFTVSILRSYENSKADKICSPAFMLIPAVLLIVTFIYALCLYVGDINATRKSKFILLLLNLLTALSSIYLIFYNSPIDFDADSNLTGFIALLSGILMIIIILVGVLIVWVNLGLTTKLLLYKTNTTSKLVKTFCKGNFYGFAVIMFCAFFIESWTDTFVISYIIWNIVFFIIFFAIPQDKSSILNFLAVLLLWGVCIVPTLVVTVRAFEIAFFIICIFYFVTAFIASALSSKGSYRKEEPSFIINGREVVRDGGSDIYREKYGSRVYKRVGENDFEEL